MSGQTPGPWTVGRKLPGEGILISGADGAPVAVVADETTGYGQLYGLPADENARLIAAAPDLLEALKVAERLLTEHLGRLSVKTHFHEINQLENTIRAAIAKAEGRNP